MKMENIAQCDVRPANERHPGKYDPIFEEIRKCEPGEGVCVTPDDNKPLDKLKTAIMQAGYSRRTADNTVPRIRCFVTDDDRVAVIRK